ncbi:fatty acid/sphingolipid desaturase [Actinidia rufa]|uniref:Fatty acid/sphingolipid desaturase n=1 Tax=Actinidia rufa TaxID=165716 RepID=A0A7J0F1E4_9ERIC|nr:fatty acid/sphingolipid desaturase [Actinidia rufa]
MGFERKYVSQEELRKHDKPGDLWISIQGKVYDVTDWVKTHPGGDTPLLNLAGQDATDAFIAFHPGTAWQHLDQFFTGFYLKDFEISEVSKDYRRLASEFSKSGMFDRKNHLVTYLGHDSGHYNIMTSRGFNKLAQILTGNCLTGISIAWWKWTHNAHHIACNSLDYDPDLQHLPFFAVSSSLFDSITSSFYGRKLTFDPLSRFLGSEHFRNSRVLDLVSSPGFVPTQLDRERVLFVLASFTVTSIQHLQFCLNHFSADVYLGPPKGDSWFEKQTRGTIDISCSSWMDWFHGGLQFQLEHHLFPRLPRCHLRSISPLVRELCKKHELPYRSFSFYEANVRTIKTLRDAAMQARGLIWEAVNTHG